MFTRRKDGTWRRRDTMGRLCPVNRQGAKIAKPRVFTVGGQKPADQARPPSVSPHIWWKVYTTAQRAQWWRESREQPAEAGEAQEHDSANVAVEGDENDDLWERWDRIIEMHNDPSFVHREYRASVDGVTIPAMPAQAGDCRERVPTMPKKRGAPRPHRDKVQGHFDSQICMALVARPVGRAEIVAKPMAAKAMIFEWDRLRNQTVWDDDHPRDWYDVKQEALRDNFDLHLGRLAGICVEKELRDGAGIPHIQGKTTRRPSVGSVVLQPHWRPRKRLTSMAAYRAMSWRLPMRRRRTSRRR